MLLSDVQIREYVRKGEIELVDPECQPVMNPETGREREPGQLQTHGYDLRINRVFSWGTNSWIELADGERYTIAPGEFVVIDTYERIRLGNSVAATVHAMARKTLSGLNHISTTVHPGWAENEPNPLYLLVAVFNVSKAPVLVERRERFCRLLFWEMSSEPTTPPPNLNMVAKEFRNVRDIMEPRYARTNKMKAAALAAGSVVVAIATLLLVSSFWPQLSGAVTSIVVALLTLALNEVTRRYRKNGLRG